jgi:hypothetical protein
MASNPHSLGTVEALIDRWTTARAQESNLVEFLEVGDPSEPLVNLNFAWIRQGVATYSPAH